MMADPNRPPPPYSHLAPSLRIDTSALSDETFRLIQDMIQENVENAIVSVSAQWVTHFREQINELINTIEGLRVEVTSMRLIYNSAIRRLEIVERGMKKDRNSGSSSGGQQQQHRNDSDFFEGLGQNRSGGSYGSGLFDASFPPLVPPHLMPRSREEVFLRGVFPSIPRPSGPTPEQRAASIRENGLFPSGGSQRNGPHPTSGFGALFGAGEGPSRRPQNEQRDAPQRNIGGLFGSATRGVSRLASGGSLRQDGNAPDSTDGRRDLLRRASDLLGSISLHNPTPPSRNNIANNLGITPPEPVRGDQSLLDLPITENSNTSGIDCRPPFGVQGSLQPSLVPGQSQNDQSSSNTSEIDCRPPFGSPGNLQPPLVPGQSQDDEGGNNRTFEQRLEAAERRMEDLLATGRFNELGHRVHQRSVSSRRRATSRVDERASRNRIGDRRKGRGENTASTNESKEQQRNTPAE